MYLTVTRVVMLSCGELVDWDEVEALVGLTLDDETGDQWQLGDTISIHDQEGAASYSVPLGDPKAYEPILGDLSPEAWKCLKADPLFGQAPTPFRAAVAARSAQADAEDAEAEANEVQHAAEHLAWQENEYGKGI